MLPTDAFHDHPAILSRYMPPLDTDAEVLKAIDVVKVLNDSNLHSLDGPLWYRGNVVCSELIEVDKLSGALEAIGANRVVIGHTPTPGRRVLERLDGQIIEIDTGMLNNYYGGSANVLIIDAAGVSVINQDKRDGCSTCRASARGGLATAGKPELTSNLKRCSPMARLSRAKRMTQVATLSL